MPRQNEQIKVLPDMPATQEEPQKKDSFNLTALTWHTCLWLLLPVLVFMGAWMHWYISLPLAGLLLWSVRPGNTVTNRNGAQQSAKPPFPLFTRPSVLVLCGFIILMVLSGWGGWVNQHPDHIVRNACLEELVSSPWPVTFPDGDVLIYNIGFWLMPALAGKLAGMDAARAILPLWGAWGLFLTWLWLTVFAGRRCISSAVIMILFGSLLNFQDWLALDMFRLHYFGVTEQLMCSANASIPVLLFFVFLTTGKIPLNWMPVLFACVAFYSPLAALGGLPLLLCQWIRQGRASSGGLWTLLSPSALASVALGSCLLIYYGHVSASGSHMGIRPFYTGWQDILLTGTSFLIYAAFCWRDSRHHPLFLCTVITGLLLPFFYITGDVNDLLCKGSVPVMACMLAFLVHSHALHARLHLWIWLLLALGLAPRFNLPYYLCAFQPLRQHLQSAFAAHDCSSASPCWSQAELKRLSYTDNACLQTNWEGTMHHPEHRWYAYYSGKPGAWYAWIYCR